MMPLVVGSHVFFCSVMVQCPTGRFSGPPSATDEFHGRCRKMHRSLARGNHERRYRNETKADRPRTRQRSHLSHGPHQSRVQGGWPESEARYSISEWWLDPHTQGPGAHSHPEDDIFYVIEGTMSVLVDEEWTDAPRGSFVLVPGGVTHDFENRGSDRAGVLNLSIPGLFEPHMPSIVQWFTEHPQKDAGT